MVLFPPELFKMMTCILHGTNLERITDSMVLNWQMVLAHSEIWCPWSQGTGLLHWCHARTANKRVSIIRSFKICRSEDTKCINSGFVITNYKIHTHILLQNSHRCLLCKSAGNVAGRQICAGRSSTASLVAVRISGNRKWCPCTLLFMWGKKKKAHGVRSAEHEGCGKMVETCCFVSSSWTKTSDVQGQCNVATASSFFAKAQDT